MILGILGQLVWAQIAPVNSAERLRAVGKTFTDDKADMAPWVVVGAGLAAIAVVILLLMLYQRREQVREAWRLFRERAAHEGLSDQERVLLSKIAAAAGLKNPVQIFTSPQLFDAGLAEIRRQSAAEVGPGNVYGGVCDACWVCGSLQEKLRFLSASTESAGERPVQLGPVRTGATLMIYRATAEPTTFEAVLVEAKEALGHLNVWLPQPVDFQPGETWVVRFPDGGLLWEFTAKVLTTENEEVVLGASDNARQIERRAFVRVPTSREARIAPFPFENDQPRVETPRFTPARVIELAGPGVLVETDLDAKKHDRVLLVLELSNTSAEAMGVVRRAEPEMQRLAIELMGLNTRQIARLVSETNHDASRQRRAQLEAEESSNDQPTGESVRER